MGLWGKALCFGVEPSRSFCMLTWWLHRCQKAVLCYILKWWQEWKLDAAQKVAGTDADFLLLSQGVGTEQKFSDRSRLSADKGSFSYQLGWKSPGNISERSHFRCSFSHPLLPILNHMPEWQVLWECSIGPTDSFSHLKTKLKQVAPKLLFRNAFCVTHHSSWMEISFSISQSLAICLFVCYHSFIFSKLCTWLNCLWYHSCEQLEGTKNKYRPH